MKRIVFVVATFLLCSAALGQESQRQRLEKHLYTLAADSLNGRQAGSPDAVRAASYITAQWQAMGLKPMFGDSYQMPFSRYGSQYCNLVAVVEGNDPLLKKEYIVVGAHYDHLGIRNGEIYNGADDNASGSSCIIEVARQLLANRHKLRRSVIVCAFDAEEIGLFGSKELAKELKSRNEIGNVKLMMSVDMVGWYKAGGSLILEGTGTLDDVDNLIDPKAMGIDIRIKSKRFENSLFTATDTEPFAKEGVPTLAVTTGIKSPYHKPQDDADLIDYEGLDRVTDYIVALTLKASTREGTLASGRLAEKHRTVRRDFQFGVSGGYNSSHLSFPHAAVDGKSLLGGQAGLMLQWNISSVFALHADVLYSYTRSRYPNATDAFGGGYRLLQHSVTLPLLVQARFGSVSSAVYIHLGGFYSRVLEPSSPNTYAPNPNQWGIAWGAGMSLGYHWRLDFTSTIQCNDLFFGAPTANKDVFSCTLGYYF